MLENWECCPRGVGIDLVRVSALRALDIRTGGAFVRRSFTEAERAEAGTGEDRWDYLAGRFAVKEAVFKAVAHLTPEKAFDFRLVETLRRPDGSPAVTCTGPLGEILHHARVERLLVSITGEDDYALALVQACGREPIPETGKSPLP